MDMSSGHRLRPSAIRVKPNRHEMNTLFIGTVMDIMLCFEIIESNNSVDKRTD